MIKLIFAFMAIFVLSFTIVPIFSGVSNERDALLASAIDANEAEDTPSLTFEEIYALADENAPTIDPAALNAIMPAAGANTEEFSSGFSGTETKGLEDSPIPQEILDEVAEEFSAN